MSKPVCVVVGVGPGNGAALVRRFAREGYAVAMLARTTELSTELARELDGGRAYACDASDAASIRATFAAVRRDLGEPSVLLYNAGSGIWGSVEDVTVEQMEAAYRVNVVGLFACAREVIGPMKTAGRGAIVVTGATASLRGGARFAAFAAAKSAQRSLAQSMARQLWPSGIHVAYVILDGSVDLPGARSARPDAPDDAFIAPDEFAATVYWLTQQSPRAWSFEVEARPSLEKW